MLLFLVSKMTSCFSFRIALCHKASQPEEQLALMGWTEGL